MSCEGNTRCGDKYYPREIFLHDHVEMYQLCESNRDQIRKEDPVIAVGGPQVAKAERSVVPVAKSATSDH